MNTPSFMSVRGNMVFNLSVRSAPVCAIVLALAAPSSLYAGLVPASPLANTVFDVDGSAKPCASDVDCRDGETGPIPQTDCRDSNGDGISDQCYVRRQRYLSVIPNPANAGATYAIRVSLETQTAGTLTLGFAQTPENSSTGVNTGPASFDFSLIQSNPVYLDWSANLPSGVLSIGDCEVAPGYDYVIQTIAEGSDIESELNYSTALHLSTCSHWGDVSGGGNPGRPPNGAKPTFGDMLAIVLGFQSNYAEPLDWLDLNGFSAPNGIVNLADVRTCVQAFQGLPYFGKSPTDCD